MRVNVALNGLPVYVTSHAIFERLRERLKPFDEFDELPEWDDFEGWFDKLAQLLSEVVPDDLDPVHRVRRLISNKGVVVEYYRNHRYDLRFVIYHDPEEKPGEPNGRLVVLTTEKPYENRS